MLRRTLFKATGSAAVALGLSSQALPAAAAPKSGYLIGTGIYDITGAAAETGAFGYASGQEMTGMHTRLYARAFIVVDVASGTRVAYVSCDLGAVFQSVKVGVVKALKVAFGGTYTDQNVMLTATHTHSANAGHSWNRLYHLASNDGAAYGWDQRNYDAVVSGIVAAITRADANLEPGSIRLASAEVTGATKSRASKPYSLNKDAAAYASEVNTAMVQLNFVSAKGEALGVLNWFPLHPTAFPMDGVYLNSDNKGYAQLLFETKMGTNVALGKTFVAAFANTDAGDVVSAKGNSKSLPGYQGSADDFENVRTDGVRQYEPAAKLWGKGKPLSGPVDFRSQWINLEGAVISAEFTGGDGEQKLAIPARGWSFAAGGPNGPSNIPGVYPGMTIDNFNIGDTIAKIDTSAGGTLTRLALATFARLGGVKPDPLQGKKPILLPNGKWGWSPLITQVQVMRIGNLAIAAMPGEITTMCGRRIRAQLRKALAPAGVTDVVVACYANDYLGYTATTEEYQAQFYEGASTEFGPYQLPAYQQEYALLADAMVAGKPVSQAIQPQDLSKRMPLSRPGVVFDDLPPGQSFGQVLTQPEKAYQAGATASAVFRSGHPKNNFRTMGTFLEVQRQVDGAWVTHRTDRDWDTTYRWQRQGVAYSRATITWRIPAETPKGTYRLVHSGEWKHGVGGAITSYTGSSNPFTVA